MIKTERSRGKYADYSDCIDDDFSVIDSDDSVCDDDRDGLLPNEIQSYNQELKEMAEFRSKLISELGYSGFEKWKRQYCLD